MAMSRKQLKFSALFCSFFAIGVGVASYLHNHHNLVLEKNHFRTIASVKASSTIHMEKHLMPVTVQIATPPEIPEGPGELITLKGKVRTNYENFGSISFEWLVPHDVQIIQGQIAGDIQNPVAGQDYEIEIKLKDFDRQYRKELTLKANVLDPNGNLLHNSAVITSRPEDSMEHLAPAMMVQAREFAEKNRMPASAKEKQ